VLTSGATTRNAPPSSRLSARSREMVGRTLVQVDTHMDLQRKRDFDQDLRLWDEMPQIGLQF